MLSRRLDRATGEGASFRSYFPDGRFGNAAANARPLLHLFALVFALIARRYRRLRLHTGLRVLLLILWLRVLLLNARLSVLTALLLDSFLLRILLLLLDALVLLLLDALAADLIVLRIVLRQRLLRAALLR